MTLFLTLLPIYLLGNLHCLGMCGPLVAMLGRHRYRFHYFLGRLLSFSLAGWLAGAMGEVLGATLSSYHLSAFLSFTFGSLILLVALNHLIGLRLPGSQRLALAMADGGKLLTPLMMQDRRLPTFLFGFFTLALPCGQTLIVFSACAVAGDAAVGLINGALFALLTSPSLFIAMHAYRLLPRLRQYASPLLGSAGLIVACLALARGLAEMGIIPHLVLSSAYHVVIY